MNTALYRGVNFLSKCFTASGYFWIYTFKGLVVYGFLPAACALTAVLADIKHERDDDKISVLVKEYYERYRHVRAASFVLSLAWITILSGLYLISFNGEGHSLLFLIIVIYLLGLTLVMTAYLIHFLVFGKMQLRQALAFSFVYCIKKWLHTLLVLAVAAVLYLLSSKNLIVFIFIFPFLLVLSASWILDKAKLPQQKISS